MDYKEKLKLAKEALDSGSYDKDTIEYIFPELKRKESEDEKVRKAIHIYLDWLDGRKDYTPKGKYSIKDMIAWLEKQGKSYTKKDVDNAFIEGMAFAKDELEKQSEQKLQGKSALEVIKEEKADNANKIEPKDYHNIDPHFGILID